MQLLNGGNVEQWKQMRIIKKLKRLRFLAQLDFGFLSPEFHWGLWFSPVEGCRRKIAANGSNQVILIFPQLETSSMGNPFGRILQMCRFESCSLRVVPINWWGCWWSQTNSEIQIENVNQTNPSLLTHHHDQGHPLSTQQFRQPRKIAPPRFSSGSC